MEGLERAAAEAAERARQPGASRDDQAAAGAAAKQAEAARASTPPEHRAYGLTTCGAAVGAAAFQAAYLLRVRLWPWPRCRVLMVSALVLARRSSWTTGLTRVRGRRMPSSSMERLS